MGAVLVVDDEADVRLVARVILEAVGYDVREAESGEAALAALEDGYLPDVMLLDVRMPGIDGWEVLHRLRRNPGDFADLPVVVFTADISIAEQAPIAFCDREFFLGKPFDPDDLVGQVARAAACWAAGPTPG